MRGEHLRLGRLLTLPLHRRLGPVGPNLHAEVGAHNRAYDAEGAGGDRVGGAVVGDDRGGRDGAYHEKARAERDQSSDQLQALRAAPSFVRCGFGHRHPLLGAGSIISEHGPPR